MVTIKDIAQKTGVTATTVSRVINNRGYISDATREKVWKAIEEMHYRPNEVARQLARQHTDTIGIIVPHISHPYFAKLISNLEYAATRHHYKILLCNSREEPEKEAEYLEMCIANKVSGIVLCSKYLQAEKFRFLDIPIINLERMDERKDIITIQSDNYEGGRLAAQHLIDKGCRSLLHFGGVAGKNMPADRRADGFRDVCLQKGVSNVILQSDQKDFESLQYQDHIRKSLEKNPAVDGIFASSDLIALQVIQVCSQMKIEIPAQMKLIGFDDVGISSMATPAITTIHQPIREMSELSIEYIDKKLRGETVPLNVYMPVRLIERDST
ncbi:MAG: LacI family transcriptional regulator [Lachnospiraceae bacterium]|jgi:Transcriptional regulators|nr:LacI family transcriptional regulator [Lachnospiraceae bacterium]